MHQPERLFEADGHFGRDRGTSGNDVAKLLARYAQALGCVYDGHGHQFVDTSPTLRGTTVKRYRVAGKRAGTLIGNALSDVGKPGRISQLGPGKRHAAPESFICHNSLPIRSTEIFQVARSFTFTAASRVCRLGAGSLICEDGDL